MKYNTRHRQKNCYSLGQLETRVFIYCHFHHWSNKNSCNNL